MPIYSIYSLISNYKVNANNYLERDLNPRPSDLASDALPTEPSRSLWPEWGIERSQVTLPQLYALNITQLSFFTFIQHTYNFITKLPRGSSKYMNQREDSSPYRCQYTQYIV